MVYFKLILLTIYSIGVITFCISTLRDVKSTKKPKNFLEWYGAIILPIASVIGVFAHHFELQVLPTTWNICFTIWLTACVAFFLELRDLRDHDEKVTMVTVMFGLFLIGLIFGPGLFLGGAWLFEIGATEVAK
jgi:hypothetical protein